MTDITAPRQHDPAVADFLQRHVEFQNRVRELETENAQLLVEIDRAHEKIAQQDRIIRRTAESRDVFKSRCVAMATEISGISTLCLRALETSKQTEWRDNGGEDNLRRLPSRVPQLPSNEVKT